MTKGQRFHCLNAECGCEVEIIKDSTATDTSNLRCGCGAVMKKTYVKPSVTSRPFVRSDFPLDEA
jgi:hypothetical protein